MRICPRAAARCAVEGVARNGIALRQRADARQPPPQYPRVPRRKENIPEGDRPRTSSTLTA
jgi:hypothetical protein